MFAVIPSAYLHILSTDCVLGAVLTKVPNPLHRELSLAGRRSLCSPAAAHLVNPPESPAQQLFTNHCSLSTSGPFPPLGLCTLLLPPLGLSSRGSLHGWFLLCLQVSLSDRIPGHPTSSCLLPPSGTLLCFVFFIEPSMIWHNPAH